MFLIPLPEPGSPRERARVLTEGRKADKFTSAPRRTEKGGGPGAAFLAYFLSLQTRSRAGYGAAGPDMVFKWHRKAKSSQRLPCSFS